MKTNRPSMNIVMMSEMADIALLFEAMKQGAHGYLIKTLHPASRHEYLRSVVLETASLSKELGYHLLNVYMNQNPSVSRNQRGNYESIHNSNRYPSSRR
jgi:DNA-binding NarL/FixJ family response regulator